MFGEGSRIHIHLWSLYTRAETQLTHQRFKKTYPWYIAAHHRRTDTSTAVLGLPVPPSLLSSVSRHDFIIVSFPCWLKSHHCSQIMGPFSFVVGFALHDGYCKERGLPAVVS